MMDQPDILCIKRSGDKVEVQLYGGVYLRFTVAEAQKVAERMLKLVREIERDAASRR